MPIQRISLFKVLDEDHIPTMLDAYRTLEKDQQKDGKPYILEIRAYQTIPDARSQGYSVVGMTKFASLDDMKFYDTECPAHNALKALNKGKIDVPVLTTFFEVP